MGFGGLVRSVVSSVLPSVSGAGFGGIGDVGKMAFSLFSYKRKRDAIRRNLKDEAYENHAKRMALAGKKLRDLTQKYNVSGVKMAGTPSLVLNKLERTNVNEIDGLLGKKLAQSQHMKRVTKLNMIGMLFNQKRKLF